MKTIWKVSLTIGIFVLFFFAMVGTLVILGGTDIGPTGNKIAVIQIKGEITSESCGGGLFGATGCAQASTISKKLKDADNDPNVRAIVLDINSGGGGVVASGNIMQAIRDTEKPVVAYIGDSGASGAYYAASAADWIIADRNSLTGSIGVIMTLTHYYGLYDKLGINTTVIKAGKSKDIGSPYRPMTEAENQEFTEMVDKIHLDFIQNVAINRNTSFEEIEKLADGSIYLGIEAKENGLIDDTGNLDDAVTKASELAGLEGEPSLKVDKQENEITLLDLFTKYEGIIEALKWAELNKHI